MNTNLKMYGKRLAFTLAEVLITLGIIGVVAALTLPTLMVKQQEAATVSQLKKAYSTLSNAFTLAVKEDGTPDTWDLAGGGSASQGAVNLMNKLTPYLSITKNCVSLDPNVYKGCVVDDNYRYLGGNTWSNFNNTDALPKVLLSDGAVIMAEATSSTCANNVGNTLYLSSSCANIYIDTNGMKKPNQAGYDLFLFHFTKYGVVPYGAQQITVGTFASNCKNKLTNPATTGWSCAAWLIYNDNMDYLHCSDLDWNTKTKCN